MLKNVREIHGCIVRYMTYQEGIKYLKPFIFEIHPDFYHQNPEAKILNETNLKFLYHYLNSLDGRTVKSLKLQFILKNNNFKQISLFIQENSVNNAVHSILKSSENFIRFSKIPHKTVEPSINNNENLFDVSSSNIADIRKKIDVIDFIRESLSNASIHRQSSTIIESIISELRSNILLDPLISDIIWKSDFNNSRYLASLKSLNSLILKRKLFHFPTRIIFTSEYASGINCYGDFILSCRQVPTQWLKEIEKNVSNYYLTERMRHLEEKVSTIFQGSKIVLLEDYHFCCLAKDYERDLNKFIFTLNLQRPDKYNRIDNTLCYAITNMTSKPFIDESSGTVVLPAFIEAKSLINFLDLDHQSRIPDIKMRHNELKREFDSLNQILLNEFNCRKVVVNDNVNLTQVVDTLKILIQEIRLRTDRETASSTGILDFQQSDLIVDHHFGITVSGDVVIPWNFWKQ